MGRGASTAQDGAKRVLTVFICHSSQKAELRKRISSASSSSFAAFFHHEDENEVLIITESFTRKSDERPLEMQFRPPCAWKTSGIPLVWPRSPLIRPLSHIVIVRWLLDAKI